MTIIRTDNRIDDDFVLLILLHLPQLNSDPLPLGTRYVLSDIVGFDRNLAMAPVDQDSQTDGAGPTRLEDDAERILHGSAGIDDIIDQDNRPILNLDKLRLSF